MQFHYVYFIYFCFVSINFQIFWQAYVKMHQTKNKKKNQFQITPKAHTIIDQVCKTQQEIATNTKN